LRNSMYDQLAVKYLSIDKNINNFNMLGILCRIHKDLVVIEIYYTFSFSRIFGIFQ